MTVVITKIIDLVHITSLSAHQADPLASTRPFPASARHIQIQGEDGSPLDR